MVSTFKTSDEIIELIEAQEGTDDDKNRIISKVLMLAESKSGFLKVGLKTRASKVEESLQDILDGAISAADKAS